MGDRLSVKADVNRFVNGISEGPDLRVNKNIKMFTSLSSSDNLRQHYQKRKMEAGDCNWIKSLTEKLGGLTPAPKLAGLGALAIAVLIDIVSFSPPEESTKEALRCVFAEEKASEVWDLVDECLKRCMMHIKNNDRLKSDIERIEWQLSAALTKLKNSMVRDGHMSSQALKAWVNGVAFHIQMLIHLVRLGGIQTCDPVERLLSAYQSDLDKLFKQHREMIGKQCRNRMEAFYIGPITAYLVDEDSKWHSIGVGYGNFEYEKYLNIYYDHRYGRQGHEIQQYFSDVRENLQTLVHQRGFFNVN